MLSRALPMAFVLAVYVFVYLPIGLVVLTAFNEATITTLPIEGYSLKWFEALFTNSRTLDALWTSVVLGVAGSVGGHHSRPVRGARVHASPAFPAGGLSWRS